MLEQRIPNGASGGAMVSDDQSDLEKYPEAQGEDEKERPQPADEAAAPAGPDHSDLLAMLQQTIARLERDGTTRGDLKILNRTLRELRYAFKVFQPFRRRRKVTVFGSARTAPTHPAYQQAVALGRTMAGHGWMVITGAGGGIMEAGHLGAGRDLSMGLNILLPFEQSANPIIDGDPKLVTLKYFFTRKLMFVKECSAVICLPGGFGTLDETLEVLTLLQTGKQTMIPVVLLDEPGGSYWTNFGAFVDVNLLHTSLISPEDLALYTVTDSVEVAVQHVLNFYRVYHSMRYVNNYLVLRIRKAVTDEQLSEINESFADIVVNGAIEQIAAMPEESNEPELSHLPRLRLHFDRRRLGRLRQLIDAINATCPECELSAQN